MKKCFNERLSTAESIKAGKTAVDSGTLSARASICLDDYNAIRNRISSFKSQCDESMDSHADLLRFHRKHSLNRYSSFMEIVEKHPHSIVLLSPPAETVSSSGNASSCFMISSPTVLHSFFKLHEAKRGYKWHCKFHGVNILLALLAMTSMFAHFQKIHHRYSQIGRQSHQHQKLGTVHCMYILREFQQQHQRKITNRLCP